MDAIQIGVSKGSDVMNCINMDPVLYEINTDKILDMLPHRYPFLLIDKVYITEVGKSGYGIKNVTVNESYFQGHFIGHPIVPGALIIESLAQTMAIVYNSSYFDEGKIKQSDLKSNVGYLAAVNVKFLKVVVPGDTMQLHVELINKFSNISSFNARVVVNNCIIAKGSITVTENQ